MSDCIFCKIVAGELPAEKVYEDDQVLSFLDIFPVRPGHTLVIPKTHVRTLTEATPEVLAQVTQRLPRIATALMKGLGAGGVNLGSNCEEVAGQKVFHLHFHLIPRQEGDGLVLWDQREYSPGEMTKTGEAIRKAIL